MQPIQVSAHLANGIAVYDDWTPQIEGLIIYQIFKEKRMQSNNPNHDEARANMAAIANDIPLEKWNGLFKASSPMYLYRTEETTKFRKRWEPDGRVKWGGRKAKFDTTAGPEKSYDLPLFTRLTSRIDWYVVGDLQEIKRLLSSVTGLGKKRAHGYGQVHQWDFVPLIEDWSIVREGRLTKAIPCELLNETGAIGSYEAAEWGHTPPIWLPENKSLCAMPKVVKQCH